MSDQLHPESFIPDASLDASSLDPSAAPTYTPGTFDAALHAATHASVAPAPASQALPHPLAEVGSLAANYVLRLQGLVPLHPQSGVPAPDQTIATTFRLSAEPRPYGVNTPGHEKHLPYRPRNSLVLESLRLAGPDTHSITPTTPPESIWPAHLDANSPAPTFAPFQHHPDSVLTAGPSAGLVVNPVTSPMRQDSIEFFPMSSLHLPHDLPAGVPVDLAPVFLADCLAGAHTYAELMRDARQVVGMHPDIALPTYSPRTPKEFTPGSAGFSLLREGLLLPPDATTGVTPMSLDDIIDRSTRAGRSLPAQSAWFKLWATPRAHAHTPTAHDPDVGKLLDLDAHGVPRHTFAAWFDYTLLTPTPDAAPTATTFSLPYFATSNCFGSIYSTKDNLRQVQHAYNGAKGIFSDDPMRVRKLPSGHSIAHSLVNTTPYTLLNDAYHYAKSVAGTRQRALNAAAAEGVARVVYSDLHCFTMAGAFSLNRPAPRQALLTRVNVPYQDNLRAAQVECVATQEQFTHLHLLASQYKKDTVLGDVLNAAQRATIDPTLDGDLLRLAEQRRIRSSAATPRERERAFREELAALVAAKTAGTETRPVATRGRGRPKGSKWLLTLERLKKQLDRLGLMADNVLRHHALLGYSMQKFALKSHIDPTDNWTRLTPLMPPLPSSPLDAKVHGRGLPVRAVNDQHIDSLLWRSLLNKFANHPKFAEAQDRRPPLMQIMALPVPEGEPAPEWHVGTKFAVATVYIPIPAEVINEWIVTGPQPWEVKRALPEGKPNPKGLYGYYVDPLDPPVGCPYPVDRGLPIKPEVMVASGVLSVDPDLLGLSCLAQPTPNNSWNLTDDQIRAGTNISTLAFDPERMLPQINARKRELEAMSFRPGEFMSRSAVRLSNLPRLVSKPITMPNMQEPAELGDDD